MDFQSAYALVQYKYLILQSELKSQSSSPKQGQFVTLKELYLFAQIRIRCFCLLVHEFVESIISEI